MITYIYEQLKTKTIEILDEKKIDPEELINCKLLYELNDVNPKDIIQDLRPYQCLWLSDVQFKCYPETIEYFEKRKYNEHKSPLKEIDEKIIQEELQHILEIVKIITKNKVTSINQEQVRENKIKYSPDLDNIHYLCDIYNYVSDIYGVTVLRLIKTYEKLSPRKKEVIETTLTLATNERQQEYLNKILPDYFGDDFNDVLLFLPEWYRVAFKVLGFNTSAPSKRKNKTKAECTNLEKLETETDKTNDVKEAVYKEFELGETYNGKFILAKLKEIYTQLGISKPPRIKDLEEFFDYTKNNYKTSDYKLNTRKKS